LTSSPVNATVFHLDNLTLGTFIATNQVLPIPNFAKSTKRLFARNTILQCENIAVHNVVSVRKHAASRKRSTTNDQHVMTHQEIYDGIVAEQARIAEKKTKSAVAHGRSKMQTAGGSLPCNMHAGGDSD
jgi:hypothetical protein